MTETKFSDTWRELDRESGSRSGPSMVRKLVETGSGAEMHLAVSTPDGRRHLMIRMPDEWDGNTIAFPKWRGTKIGPYRGSEKPSPHQFLVLEQGDESPRDVFEVLVADVVDAVLSRKESEAIGEVIATRLDRWKAFFEERGLVGLGPEAQQGLFGELWFLREHLMPRAGLLSSISSWDITHRAVHDFQFPRHAFEVKTSAAKQHLRVHVASERQLDTTGLDSLHLIVISLSIVQGGGETLPEIVTSVRNALAISPQTARLFEDKLLDEGYMDAHKELYGPGYAFRNIRAYRVVPGFPRILENDLKPGVGEVSYSVVLSACEPFKIGIDEALDRLGPRPSGVHR